jgi:hypothetical protein
MWIFTRNGFISIVEHREDSELLLVRARRHQHLKAILPGYQVHETPHADYRYRVEVEKEHLSKVLAEAVLNIEYDNFKNSIEDHWYHDACTGVWTVMHRIQPGSYYAGVRLAHEYGDETADVPSLGVRGIDYPSPKWKPRKDD